MFEYFLNFTHFIFAGQHLKDHSPKERKKVGGGFQPLTLRTQDFNCFIACVQPFLSPEFGEQSVYS